MQTRTECTRDLRREFRRDLCSYFVLAGRRGFGGGSGAWSGFWLGDWLGYQAIALSGSITGLAGTDKSRASTLPGTSQASQGLANQTLGPNRPPHSLRRVRKCRCRPGALAAPPADRSRSQPPKRRGTCAIALLASQVTKLAGASRNSLSTVLQRQAPSLVAPVSGTPGGQIR